MSDDKYVICGPPEVDVPNLSCFTDYLYKSLDKGGNNVAQISNLTGEKMSYAEIKKRSIKLALALRELGITKGDRVAIASENRFEFTVSAIAVISLGAINAPLNVLYTRDELVHAMNISKPKLVLCSPITLYNVLDTMSDVKSIQHIISFGEDKPEPFVFLYDELINRPYDISSYKPTPVDMKKHPMVILCSSGTTGLPKGVMLTHYNMILCVRHTEEASKISPNPNDCLLSIIPWFHAFGFLTHLIVLTMVKRCVYMARFDEEGFLSAIQNYKVDIMNIVPPLMVFLAKHPSVDKYDLSSLKEIWCGAAPLSKEVQLAVSKRIGVQTIKQGYGMTETTLGVLSNESNNIKYGSCGTVVRGTQAKIVDLKTGKSLGPNQEGELCFKGPLMMLGYLGDAASTENIFDKDGWLHTGDIAYYDEDKYFYIVDRMKELIKFKAYQVPPAEVEAILLQHPKIIEAGVVGLPDEESGELPLAFVVKRPEVDLTEKEVIDFVAKQVSYPKRLHGGVRFIDEIPKNLSGKILRRELKQILKETPKSKL